MISKIELLRRWKVFIRFALYRGASCITLKERYESKCSCGKLLKDHHATGDDNFTTLKMMYDIGTCKIPENKEVWSTHKYIDLGHHKYYFLLDKSKDKYELRERYHTTNIINCKILNKMEETVTISKKEYFNLLKRDLELASLEQAGVDNWEWYSESKDDLDKMILELSEGEFKTFMKQEFDL